MDIGSINMNNYFWIFWFISGIISASYYIVRCIRNKECIDTIDLFVILLSIICGFISGVCLICFFIGKLTYKPIIVWRNKKDV